MPIPMRPRTPAYFGCLARFQPRAGLAAQSTGAFSGTVSNTTTGNRLEQAKVTVTKFGLMAPFDQFE